MREPPEIRVLSEVVANQIAAGEVIERPAAVVKELAENSLDAGATRITVRIEDGGRRLIEIEDDGHGLRPDDLRTALQRHATSKLAGAEDLFRIATLGFRGEALPSIAAVSEFAFASRPHGSGQGQVLRLDGGRETAYEAIAMAPGTRVSVRNLFWNVPARLKFLKAEAAETGHVTDQVIRLALSHPGVAFRLESGGRPLLDLPAGETLLTRVRSIFGKDLASSLLAVESQPMEGMELTGFVAHPREAKPTARRQFVFLNGRFVKDKLLLAAVREGFKGFLEPRLHGSVFLHLDVDPATVDVNVHPTKSEVRFRREGEVFVLVSKGINRALDGKTGGFTLFAETPELKRTVVKAALPPPPPAAPAMQERFLPFQPIAADEPRAEPPTASVPTAGFQPASPRTPSVTEPAADADRPVEHRRSQAPATRAEPPTASVPTPGTAGFQPASPRSPLLAEPTADTDMPVGNRRSQAPTTRAEPPAAPGHAPGTAGFQPASPRSPSLAEPTTAYRPAPIATAQAPGIRRILQLNRMYLLVETDRGIRIVDQHALHEKALFLTLDPQRLDLLRAGVQPLIVPRTVELSAAEVAAVAPILPELARWGIEAEVFGPTTVLVRALPGALKRVDWAGFFAGLAEGGADTAIAGLQERIAHSAACHAAVKAGQELSADEQRELVRLLYEMDGTEHCPHGRPTTLDLSWDDLARRFQR